MIARPVLFLEMAAEQGRPASAWRGDLPEHVGKSTAASESAPPAGPDRPGQAVELVETQPAGVRRRASR